MNERSLISKGDYASHRGVSAAAVSQYITAGYLDAALVRSDGTPADRKDRGARIDRDKADELLRRRLNTSQVLGQGKSLPAKPSPPLDASDVPASDVVAPVPLPRPVDDTADRLAALKLERAERDNEVDRRDFAAKNGLYTPTDLIRREATRAMSDQLSAFEAWLLDDLVGKVSAASVAADGKPLEHRALKLLAKSEYRAFRAARAEDARHRRDAVPMYMHDPEETPTTME